MTNKINELLDQSEALAKNASGQPIDEVLRAVIAELRNEEAQRLSVRLMALASMLPKNDFTGNQLLNAGATIRDLADRVEERAELKTQAE